VVVVIEDDDNTAQAMTELLEECHCVPVVHAMPTQPSRFCQHMS
jgi:hypothetical protein